MVQRPLTKTLVLGMSGVSQTCIPCLEVQRPLTKTLVLGMLGVSEACIACFVKQRPLTKISVPGVELLRLLNTCLRAAVVLIQMIPLLTIGVNPAEVRSKKGSYSWHTEFMVVAVQ
jgi:hypothetical protein